MNLAKPPRADGVYPRSIRGLISGKSSLPLCQTRALFGKVLRQLNVLNGIHLHRSRECLCHVHALTEMMNRSLIEQVPACPSGDSIPLRRGLLNRESSFLLTALPPSARQVQLAEGGQKGSNSSGNMHILTI